MPSSWRCCRHVVDLQARFRSILFFSSLLLALNLPATEASKRVICWWYWRFRAVQPNRKTQHSLTHPVIFLHCAPHCNAFNHGNGSHIAAVPADAWKWWWLYSLFHRLTMATRWAASLYDMHAISMMMRKISLLYYSRYVATKLGRPASDDFRLKPQNVRTFNATFFFFFDPAARQICTTLFGNKPEFFVLSTEREMSSCVCNATWSKCCWYGVYCNHRTLNLLRSCLIVWCWVSMMCRCELIQFFLLFLYIQPMLNFTSECARMT